MPHKEVKLVQPRKATIRSADGAKLRQYPTSNFEGSKRKLEWDKAYKKAAQALGATPTQRLYSMLVSMAGGAAADAPAFGGRTISQVREELGDSPSEADLAELVGQLRQYVIQNPDSPLNNHFTHEAVAALQDASGAGQAGAASGSAQGYFGGTGIDLATTAASPFLPGPLRAAAEYAGMGASPYVAFSTPKRYAEGAFEEALGRRLDTLGAAYDYASAPSDETAQRLNQARTQLAAAPVMDYVPRGIDTAARQAATAMEGPAQATNYAIAPVLAPILTGGSGMYSRIRQNLADGMSTPEAVSRAAGATSLEVAPQAAIGRWLRQAASQGGKFNIASLLKNPNLLARGSIASQLAFSGANSLGSLTDYYSEGGDARREAVRDQVSLADRDSPFLRTFKGLTAPVQTAFGFMSPQEGSIRTEELYGGNTSPELVHRRRKLYLQQDVREKALSYLPGARRQAQAILGSSAPPELVDALSSRVAMNKVREDVQREYGNSEEYKHILSEMEAAGTLPATATGEMGPAQAMLIAQLRANHLYSGGGAQYPENVEGAIRLMGNDFAQMYLQPTEDGQSMEVNDQLFAGLQETASGNTSWRAYLPEAQRTAALPEVMSNYVKQIQGQLDSERRQQYAAEIDRDIAAGRERQWSEESWQQSAEGRAYAKGREEEAARKQPYQVQPARTTVYIPDRWSHDNRMQGSVYESGGTRNPPSVTEMRAQADQTADSSQRGQLERRIELAEERANRTPSMPEPVMGSQARKALDQWTQFDNNRPRRPHVTAGKPYDFRT